MHTIDNVQEQYCGNLSVFRLLETGNIIKKMFGTDDLKKNRICNYFIFLIRSIKLSGLFQIHKT